MINLTTIPFVGPIMAKISDKTIEALLRQLKYMFRSKALVKVLKSENVKLETEADRMSTRAAQESNNGRVLEKYVVDWQKDVQKNQEIVTRCLEKNDNLKSQQQDCPHCIRCLPFPHPFSRYGLGKQAAKVTKSTTDLTAIGIRHLANPIAYLSLDMNVPVTAFQNFKSRQDAYEKLEGLVTDGSSLIVGIYGIPGAGKTRLVEQITTEAGKKGTFDKVVRANVGNKNLDVIGIQEQLAGNLRCKFESKTDVGHRAGQLRSSLRNGGKILIILDDVWRKIPLETIGILSADGMSSRGGKILLTSRSYEVCGLNNCAHPVKIKPLTFAESWDMFSKTVGAGKIDSLQNISLAKDICKRCGGLPLLILPVGNALKLKPLVSWSDACNQLKNSKIERVAGIHGDVDVYPCLKLSFDNLEDDAMACLLLASMFPEDADIPIRMLVQLAKGSQLITEADKIRVCSMLYNLKSSSLLLNGMDSEHIKLHDVIRDMARSIAIKDHAFLFARSGSLPRNHAQFSGKKILHLEIEEAHLGFPTDLACPDLHTLSLEQRTWPPIMLQGWVGDGQIFSNLTFLVLVRFLWPLEYSLKSLGKLKTLWFENCDLINFGKTDIIFLPEKLENLCMWNCLISGQLNLPELKLLRRLEIYSRDRVSVVPHTISRLSSLEELCLPDQFSIREKHARYVSVPVLDEISGLSRLTSLHICSEESRSSNLATIFPNLSEFHIFVGEALHYQAMELSPVRLRKSIMLFNHNLVEGYQTLIEKAEQVILCSTDFTGSSIRITDIKEFTDLRYMHIDDSKVMEHLARISPHDEIQESLQQSTPFSNLIKLEIKSCPSLKYLFCNSVARCLVQLQELKIEHCRIMEEVVLGEGISVGNIINLPKLRILILNWLPRLVHFYKDNIPSGQIQPLFNGMVTFPSLEQLQIIGLEHIAEIWGDNNGNASSFSELKILSVINCDKLENVIPPVMLSNSLKSKVHTNGSNTDSVTGGASEGHVKTMVSQNPKKNLHNFWKKTVHVSRSVCRNAAIIEENLNDPSHIPVQVPPQNTRVCPLVQMILSKLPSLKTTGLNFENQSGAVSLYPNLSILDINECNKLENVFIPSPDGHSMNLETMSVTRCTKMREIIGAGKLKITDGIVFHKLLSLVLSDLPGLTSFWECPSGEANSHKVKFPILKRFELGCGEITSLETIELGRDGSTYQLENLDISFGKEIQIPNQWVLQLNNLESLSLTRCWSDELKSLPFQRLKELTLCELSCSTIFSFPDFERLQQLQKIKIINCDLLEEIVEVVKGEEASGTDTETVALLQLKTINLNGLPKLRSFIRTKFKNFIRNLEQEEVKPSILITCSVFGNLQQLERLEVIDCRLLEGIVEVARGYETSDTDESLRIITFPRLSAIKLIDLPNLQNFSHTTSYSFKMPSLHHFHLIRCPQVENKPSLRIIAEWVTVYCEDHPRRMKVQNFDYYMRQRHIGRINNLEGVRESSYSSNLEDVEIETMSVEEEMPQEQSKLMKLMRMIVPQ